MLILMSSVISVIISPEDLAFQFAKATADTLIEQGLVEGNIIAKPESVERVTDLAFSTQVLELSDLLGREKLASEPVVAGIADSVRDKLAELWTDFRNWISTHFREAGDKLQELAKKILETAERYAISAAHLLGRLYRRVVTFIVESSIVPPFTVGEAPKAVTIRPTELSLSYTVKSAPSLASMDLTGITKILSGLLEMTLMVSVKYTGT